MNEGTDETQNNDSYPYDCFTVDDDRSQALLVDSPYCDIEYIPISMTSFEYAKYCAMHLNIHSLPSKFYQLKNLIVLLNESCINLHFILL